MIGSPWNPFFNQSIPGSSKRYDGRRVDSGDYRQVGAWDQIALPQYLEINGDGFGDPVVLTRHYALFGTNGEKMQAETLQAVFGALWGSQVVSDLLETGFLWWHWNFVSWDGGLPRVFYYSDPNVGGLTSERRWFFGFGIEHYGVNYPDDVVEPVWENVASLFATDDVPESMGGSPALWAKVPGTTIVEPGEEAETYPIYHSGEILFNANIQAGSRLESEIDLTRPFVLRGYSTDPFGSATLSPWYRSNR